LYYLVKTLVRIGLVFFCRKIIISNEDWLKEKGPLLLACNHPNSFFDAVLLGALFKNPVHFLARGDAFKNPVAKNFLTALKAIPIFRLREGKEYLALNDATFDRCNQILLQGGIVLIFSEGLCLNQWQLRPLKKGSARIAINAWKQADIASRFKVLPVSLNYNSFKYFGKKIIIQFGQPIICSDINTGVNEAEQINQFNKLLYTRLLEGILIDDNTAVAQFLLSNPFLINEHTNHPISFLKSLQPKLASDNLRKELSQLYNSKAIALQTTSFAINIFLFVLLFIPAVIALGFHLPLYIPLRSFIKKKTKGTVFYDSVLFGSLLILYPLYLIIISVVGSLFIHPLCLFAVIAVPVLALLYLHWKESLVCTINYCRMRKESFTGLKTEHVKPHRHIGT